MESTESYNTNISIESEYIDLTIYKNKKLNLGQLAGLYAYEQEYIACRDHDDRFPSTFDTDNLKSCFLHYILHRKMPYLDEISKINYEKKLYRYDDISHLLNGVIHSFFCLTEFGAEEVFFPTNMTEMNKYHDELYNYIILNPEILKLDRGDPKHSNIKSC